MSLQVLGEIELVVVIVIVGNGLVDQAGLERLVRGDGVGATKDPR